MRAQRTERLLTWATNKPKKDRNIHLADVLSVNDYPGWYAGAPNGIAKYWKKAAAWAAEHYPSKPYLIAEAGAGAIAGWRNNGSHRGEPLRWSEELQAEIVRRDVQAALDDDNIAGICMWQLLDIAVDRSIGRLRNGRAGEQQGRARRPAGAQAGRGRGGDGLPCRYVDS